MFDHFESSLGSADEPMLTEGQLRDADVFQWSELRSEFRNADLLLGNGFSIKLAAQLSYPSLFVRFLEVCNAQRKRLFEGLDSTNFEELQRILLDAKRVATLLDSALPDIDAHLQALREGLITVIHEFHPRAAEIDRGKLQDISGQFDHFGDIFTTNYDLFLYHITMISKDRSLADANVRPYNDYFWHRLNDQFLEFRGFQNYKRYKHTYYLHGALFIFPGEQPGDDDRKLRRGDDWELLDSIDTLVRDGQLPLFVAEGTTRQKKRAIAQSRYLIFALNHLTLAAGSIVIYGCAFGDSDRHIIDALKTTRRSLAVAIHVGEKLKDEIEADVKAIHAKLAEHAVVIFDSRGLF
jgi:hypothetical protein